MNFAEVIHSILEPIRSLLYSSTQTDVLESIEFIIAIVNTSVKGSDTGIREVLKLVWSKEAAIIEAVRNAFKTLYLSNGQDKWYVLVLHQFFFPYNFHIYVYVYIFFYLKYKYS